jgi:hypothetical protein
VTSPGAHFARPAALLLWLALMLACLSAYAAEAERIGEVSQVSGVVSAQRQGEADRFLAKDQPLFEGDVITTSATGYVQLTLKDGTKLTLRPSTTFAVDRLRHGAGEEIAAFRLLKGGMRALTGLISKRNPNGAQVSTQNATIGIRGTSFDARLCENDCAQEEARPGRGPATAVGDPIVGRVAVLAGSASAAGRDGQSRILTTGAALFSGDSVSTGPKSHAVLAFRDESKVTLAADSIFRLEDVRFTGPQMDGGNFFVRLVKGGARALTGLIAKRDPKAVAVRVGNATIGIRGTGFDTGIVTTPGPAGAPLETIFVNVWQDNVTLEAGGNSITIGQGQTGAFEAGANALGLVGSPPQFINESTTPRPDQIKVDFINLFGASTQPVGPGLYVAVRDGDVELTAVGGSIVPLGNGEAGFLAVGSTTPVRIAFPQFMLNEAYPLPEAGVRSLIVPLVPKSGSLICEIN